MPQIFKFGKYHIYFWINEGSPLEPVHVHVSEGKPSANATKVWITQTGRCILCHNASHIPPQELRKILKVIDANSTYIVQQWYASFGQITYYC